jgi:hypothetical protein
MRSRHAPDFTSWTAAIFAGAVALSLTPTGCGGSCTLSLDNYDTSCQLDSDCVGVDIGYVCGADGNANACAFCSPNAAINVASLAQWQSDRSSVPEPGGPNQCFCPSSGRNEARCSHGVCTWQEP